jgi:hypothetical protein
MKKLLAPLLLLLLASCTAAQPQYWRGFSGPAYLPARPVHHPQPVHRPQPAPLVPASVRHLDSLTAKNWAAPTHLFKP